MFYHCDNIYKHTQIQKMFYSVKLSHLWLHITTHISKRQPQICSAAHVSSYTYCYKITEGFQFMPLSLVRLRTCRLSTWVGWV